ncbi:hypothetical protein HNO88_002992 [Novosphingobium chloroacetimidivorans]|uniref:Uncharacterized protein n=1 Tax=Novosphingobium chloroacetimidivorans TaxID=1428314 RepID=A0A7W7KCG8_9SPHN|nr:hypothetical protein [Novosphingobium chloroacetimidivorans]MBB4859663.1 hypothetical protein [Novosphingobium chloroacetimidivorans]
MNAPENQAGRVDGFSVAIDMIAVVAFLAAFTALLFGADALIASVMRREPALVDFMMQWWVAPLLVLGGVVALGGLAGMLLVTAGGPERGK